MKHLVEHIAPFIKGYAKIKDTSPIYAVLSEDVGGMTYVARWVRTDSLVNIPEDLSWAEKMAFKGEKNG